VKGKIERRVGKYQMLQSKISEEGINSGRGLGKKLEIVTGWRGGRIFLNPVFRGGEGKAREERANTTQESLRLTPESRSLGLLLDREKPD